MGLCNTSSFYLHAVKLTAVRHEQALEEGKHSAWSVFIC